MGRGFLFFLCWMLAAAAPGRAAGWSLESASLGFDAAQLSNAQGREDDALMASFALAAERGRWRAGLRGGGIRYRTGDAAGRSAEAATGLADTVLTFGYELLPAKIGGVSLTLGAFTKLPTAPSRIGTGKVDGGVEINLVAYTGKVIPFGAVSYRVNGRVAGQSMRNAIQAHLGAQTSVNPRLALGAYGLFRQSAFKTVRDYRDLVAYGSFALTDRWTLLGYGTASIGPRAGDFGGGVQLRYRFGKR